MLTVAALGRILDQSFDISSTELTFETKRMSACHWKLALPLANYGQVAEARLKRSRRVGMPIAHRG